MKNSFLKISCLLFLSIFSSCGNKLDYNYPEDPQNLLNQRAGKFFDISFGVLPKSSANSVETVSKIEDKNKLWLTSIEVISALLPIDNVDEKSGLITTEWYQEGSNERIKINLLVKNKELKTYINVNQLSLTIFRQTQNK